MRDWCCGPWSHRGHETCDHGPVCRAVDKYRTACGRPLTCENGRRPNTRQQRMAWLFECSNPTPSAPGCGFAFPALHQCVDTGSRCHTAVAEASRVCGTRLTMRAPSPWRPPAGRLCTGSRRCHRDVVPAFAPRIPQLRGAADLEHRDGVRVQRDHPFARLRRQARYRADR